MAPISVIRGGGQMVGRRGEWGRHCREVKGFCLAHGKAAQRSHGRRRGGA
jgi:hypothetical protein